MRAISLKRGDTVGVAAPASPPDAEKTKRAARFLTERFGLHVELGASLQRKRGYLAGSDEERAQELNHLFARKDIRAIFTARGGYGSPRIADLLDYELMSAHPKIFWGYSDITFLHIAIGKKTGLVTFHGPMLASDLSRPAVDKLAVASIWRLFYPRPFCYRATNGTLETISSGRARGKVTGGNLTLVAATLGTPYEIETEGKLLLLEEVDEEPYRVDRLLYQLKSAGKFDAAIGILLGSFHRIGAKKERDSLTLREVIHDYFSSLKKPVLAGLPIGHTTPHLGIPLGEEAVVDADAKMLFFTGAGLLAR